MLSPPRFEINVAITIKVPVCPARTSKILQHYFLQKYLLTHHRPTVWVSSALRNLTTKKSQEIAHLLKPFHTALEMP
ncbi:hypothetical protein AB6A40_005354 [Gnathostoma spinigerum]|uniref:Uncharacterized protein n=1 Tax=Gnathostoma spinigerum TaxID=75299 RepID=A0ABD6EQV8_9BILA